MSSADDVLDSWEEIDEAGINKALAKIQAERKVQQMKIMTKDSFASQHLNRTNGESIGDEAVLSSNSTNGVFSDDDSTSSPFGVAGAAAVTSVAIKEHHSSPLNNMAEIFQPVMMLLHKSNDEYQSGNYTAPIANQTVKILRRPTQSSEVNTNDIRPRQPIKTLQQREQEYAEARLRIMGAAKNPNDDLVEPTANGSLTPTSGVPSPPMATASKAVVAASAGLLAQGNPSHFFNLQQQQQQQKQQQQQQQQHLQQQQHQQQQQQQQQQNNYFHQPPSYNNRTALLQHNLKQPQQKSHHQTWSPVVGGSVSSAVAMRHHHHQQQQQQQHQQHNNNNQHQQQPSQYHHAQEYHVSHHPQVGTVLRMPKGPDGSTGFQMRR